MRAVWFTGCIATLLAVLPPAAHAQSTELKEKTYRFAIRCYVTNAMAATDRRYNASGTNTARFRAMGQKSYSTAYQLGRTLGKSEARIDEDFNAYEAIFRSVFLRDDTSFQQARSDCAHIGLM
ncbi:MAG: hypothetical protein ACOY45_04510 [Pseudomonadota bacterium]